MSRRVVGATAVGATVAVTVGLAVGGCGTDGSASSDRVPGSGPASHSPTAGWRVGAARGAVGPGCDRIPPTGPGSIGAVASARVVTAMAHNPLLSQLARAIKAAGLANSLDSAKAVTVFAPEDSAFTALGRGNLTTLLADKSDLVTLLKGHVVKGRHTPADLASGRHLTTLLGTVIVPAKSRAEYRVNNAEVVCGNIQTANATIYIVNKVLVPVS
jgi:uncharacterized surface protein with fasciclin (FAS1) repeats